MTDIEAFEQLLTKYPQLGTRFDRRRMTTEHFDRTYGIVLKLAETLISSARSGIPTLPPIHVDFVFNPVPNAWAIPYGGRYFIAMTTGLIFMTDFLFHRMLCDARIFPLIGNPAVERSDFSPLTNYTWNAQRLAEQKVHPGPPKDGIRRIYANRQMERLLYFVIGHELAHITRGHVDYLNPQTGNPVISELDEPSSPALGAMWSLPKNQVFLERQAIEIDADQRSVHSAISSSKQIHENASANKEYAVFLANRFSVTDLLFDWSFAMNTFFRLFGDLRVNDGKFPESLYPSPPIRRFFAMNVAHGIVTELWKPPVDKHETLEALKNGAFYVEDVFQIITGGSSGHGIQEALSQEGLDYLQKLEHYWQTSFRDKLAPYSYEPRAVAP